MWVNYRGHYPCYGATGSAQRPSQQVDLHDDVPTVGVLIGKERHHIDHNQCCGSGFEMFEGMSPPTSRLVARILSLRSLLHNRFRERRDNVFRC